MFFNATASRTTGRILLASMLCMLAVAFALEAKMGWYGPEAGLKSETPHAKAMPADMARVVDHGIAFAAPGAPQTYFFITSILIAAPLIGLSFSRQHSHAVVPLPGLRLSTFSPFLTFRPPPIQI